MTFLMVILRRGIFKPLLQASRRERASDDEDALPTLSLSDCADCSTDGAADVWRDRLRTGVAILTPDCVEGPVDEDNVISGEDIVTSVRLAC